MNPSRRKTILVSFALLIAACVALAIRPAVAQSNTVVVWYVGLGGGDSTDQINVERKVTQEFNDTLGKTQHITLQLVVGGTDPDTLAIMEASGTTPDISGPTGFAGSNVFSDQWLDLKPLMEEHGYDLSGFQPAVLNLFAPSNGEFNAIPIGVYPSVVFYNTSLFDRVGLHYPPAQVGEKYVMPDGSQVEWNYDTLAQVAKRLTLDQQGNNATSAKFDSQHIAQYGLSFESDEMRLILTDIQPSPFYDADTNTVKISDDWRQATWWVWNGLWKDHFIPDTSVESSTTFEGGAFDAGQTAMAITPIWYACCLKDRVGQLKWNIAVVPESLDGKTHVATDADSFRIFKATKHPEAAFLALSYLLDDAIPELAPAYAVFPARSAYQQTWIDAENKTFPQGVNWKVAIDSLKYANPAILSHESNLPHFSQVQDRFDSFLALLYDDRGASLDVNHELDTLQADLQSIVNGTYPTESPVPTALSATAAPTASSY